jgi:hypothetical protein
LFSYKLVSACQQFLDLFLFALESN